MKKHNFNENQDNYEEDTYETLKKWYQEPTTKKSKQQQQIPAVTEQQQIELKCEAKNCLDLEVAHNNKYTQANSNQKWLKTVINKGTVSDKIAGHVVSIQNNPVCNLETIRSLVNMVKAGKKNECVTVIDSLTELFLTDLLRPNSKLKLFHQQPLGALQSLTSGNAISRRKILATWYFEDQLKEVYQNFVLALNNTAQDTVENVKEKSISAMYKLLAGNSEQEQNLLKFLINKLGDPSSKVASKATYCLNQLLLQHSNMQGVVLNEIEKLMFRSNISSRAQYYSLCFLSQFHLSNEASDVARKLIEVYFSFFKACVKKGDVDSRMMSALLTGIHRSFPYAKVEIDKIQEHIDTMYRLIHLANFNIGLHVLTILYQVSDFGKNISERFYNALYKKLIDPRLLQTTHQAILLSLVYKSLLKDTEINRIKMFIKRLLQIANYTSPNFSIGIIYLVSQVLSKKQEAKSFTLQKMLDEDDSEETYKDVVDLSDDLKVEESNTEVEPEIEIKKEPLDEEDCKNEDIKNGNASWYHCDNKKERKLTGCNLFGRNPLYCGGELSAYSELFLLKDHFHPTVSLYAKTILNGENIQYIGDPLKDFTLIRFLDRFVFKNPKKIEVKSGLNSLFAKRELYTPKGVKSMIVNSTSYTQEQTKNIPVDELFLHSFMQRRANQLGKHKKKDDDSDLESVQSEEFEEMLDKMAGLKESEEDIDFENEITSEFSKKATKQKGAKNIDEDESGSEDEISDEEDDEEFSDMEDGDKELIDGVDDEDEEMEFSDEETPKKKASKKDKKGGLNSIFASADEFATILDEEGSSKFKSGASSAFANKDNANVKQLDWEDKRNTWIRGYNKAVGTKKGNKRGGPQKFNHKSKKVKK